MKTKAVIFDLDGVLANIDHRLHFINGPNKYWDEFNAACVNDKVNKWAQNMADCLNYDYKIIIVTGRSDNYREQTVNWLSLYDIPCSSLQMRPDNDHRDDMVIKEEIYHNLKQTYDIQFVIEDRARVVEMWRKLGLVCLQCAKGDF